MMDNGRIAAVGSADGNTTIVQFSDGLVDMQLNEKQALTSVSQIPCTVVVQSMCKEPSSCLQIIYCYMQEDWLFIKRCLNVL